MKMDLLPANRKTLHQPSTQSSKYSFWRPNFYKLNLKGQSSQQTENNLAGFSNNRDFSVQNLLSRRREERLSLHVCVYEFFQ